MDNTTSFIKKLLKTVPPVRLIVVSFFLLILTGSILLTFPAASRDGAWTPFINALFTSTSAVCVTGLVVFDTWTHWSIFGQVVIICLIQVGGLGLVTFTTGFTLLLRRKLGLRGMQLAVESTGGNVIHIAHIVKIILYFTFSCEFTGALLLMLRFVPKFGLHGVWISVFTAISAYCNAGFDILGFETKGGSLMKYVGDPLVCLTVAALIIIGGIGFIVISDFYYSKIKSHMNGKPPSHLNFHSHIVLITTACLLVIGTIAIFISEYGNTMSGMNFGTRLNASFFQSASARTAGFNSLDIGGQTDFTKIITIILMFIGASPTSTGGGIKTTTMIVIIAAVFSVLRGDDDACFLKRRIDKPTVYRSLSITFLAMLVVLITSGIIILTTPHVTSINALFEAVSAFGTVGLTAGVTPLLSAIAKCAVIATMFIGRVGPVSIGLAFSLRKKRFTASTVLPDGKIIVG